MVIESMPQAGTRKRPAPGASPMQSPQSQNFAAVNHNGATTTATMTDPYVAWPQQNSVSYPDPNSAYGSNLYASANGLPAPQSNQLARRSMGQQVVPRASYNDSTGEAWPVVQESMVQPPAEGWMSEDDDLNQRAEVAKRETQAKRKQIPPFVQKLSSFLEEERNTDLIRWSERGDSFIVVDEDEFARTLIPELFKHNNYASFVRQLNMYGFHKKVGLSDNSMRASEKKNKSPSEYTNPFFRRGRPNLLWLIQKPRTSAGKGTGKGAARSRQEEGTTEEDGDEIYDVDTPAPQNQGQENTTAHGNSRQPLMIGQAGSQPSHDQIAAIQKELQSVQQNQKAISSFLQSLKRENERQALAYQSLHDRHESSINAILTFLATVYNRSLGEGQGAPNFGSGLAGAIPQNPQTQGNVVDVGDYSEQALSHHQRLFRKQPLLLKAPPSNKQSAQGSSADSPAPPMSSHLSPNQAQHYHNLGQSAASATSPSVQELCSPVDSNRSSQSPQVHPSAEDNAEHQMPEVDIMSMINTHNAAQNAFSPGTRMDFPEALSHLQNADGQTPLTDNQRHDALRLIAGATPTESTNNALTSPAPPSINPAEFNGMTTEQLDFLSNAIKEQDQKVESLSQSLAPLSPSGSIPGMNGEMQYNGSDSLEFGSFFNTGEYFNNDGLNDLNLDTTDLPDFNFETDVPDVDVNGCEPHYAYDGVTDEDGSRSVKTLGSSEATSPAVTVGEEAAEPQEEYGRGKRRKRN